MELTQLRYFAAVAELQHVTLGCRTDARRTTGDHQINSPVGG